MSRNIEEVKQRIRKLLNVASGNAATEGEIDNAMRFARRLMIVNQLDESDIPTTSTDPHEAAADRETYSQTASLSISRNLSNWENDLAHVICALIGTVKFYQKSQKVLRKTAHATLKMNDRTGRPDRATQINFYGPEEDAADASELFEEWTQLIAAMARMKYGGALRGEGRCYAEGFVAGVERSVESIKAEERKLIDQRQTLTGVDKTTALSLVNATGLMKAKRERGSQWLADTAGVKLRNMRRTAAPIVSSSALREGIRDGQRAGFSRTVKPKLEGGA